MKPVLPGLVEEKEEEEYLARGQIFVPPPATLPFPFSPSLFSFSPFPLFLVGKTRRDLLGFGKCGGRRMRRRNSGGG